jgi:hypothetical protein
MQAAVGQVDTYTEDAGADVVDAAPAYLTIEIIIGPDTHCKYGGDVVESGYDTNDNGKLDPSEVTQSLYYCYPPPVPPSLPPCRGQCDDTCACGGGETCQANCDGTHTCWLPGMLTTDGCPVDKDTPTSCQVECVAQEPMLIKVCAPVGQYNDQGCPTPGDTCQTYCGPGGFCAPPNLLVNGCVPIPQWQTPTCSMCGGGLQCFFWGQTCLID